MYKNTTGEPVNLEAVGYTTYTSADQEYDVSVYTGLTKSSDPGQSFFSKAKRSKVSGIEIQYSTSKSFSRNVRTTYAASGSKSKKLKGLKSKKRYYVRTRTYKDIGSVRQVSKWSKTITAKEK